MLPAGYRLRGGRITINKEGMVWGGSMSEQSTCAHGVQYLKSLYNRKIDYLYLNVYFYFDTLNYLAANYKPDSHKLGS